MVLETRHCPTYATVSVRRGSALAVKDVPENGDDFKWTWYSDLLVSEKARSAFDEARITGCGFARAIVDGNESSESGPLWEVCVTGFAGFAKGDVVVSDRCDECRIYSYSIPAYGFRDMLDLTKWDGSDVFAIWPFPLTYIATQRVAETIARHCLTGIAVVPIDEEFVKSGGGAPGMPSFWLSDEAAVRLEADPDYQRAIAPHVQD